MKQLKMLLMILSVGIMLLCSSQAFATLLFSENFDDLSAWIGKTGGPSYGQIVDNPVGPSNNVLNFSDTNSAGDIFTTTTFTSVTGQYILSFDYLGTKKNSGGFIGYSYGFPGTHIWLIGDDSGYTDPNEPIDMIGDNTWRSYEIAFTSTLASPIHIMVEDFLQGGGDAYFDNITLNDSAPVPEPATMLLLGIGLLGLAGFRKKLIRR